MQQTRGDLVKGKREIRCWQSQRACKGLQFSTTSMSEEYRKDGKCWFCCLAKRGWIGSSLSSSKWQMYEAPGCAKMETGFSCLLFAPELTMHSGVWWKAGGKVTALPVSIILVMPYRSSKLVRRHWSGKEDKIWVRCQWVREIRVGREMESGQGEMGRSGLEWAWVWLAQMKSPHQMWLGGSLIVL